MAVPAGRVEVGKKKLSRLLIAKSKKNYCRHVESNFPNSNQSTFSARGTMTIYFQKNISCKF